jgi:hypothetical protein
MIAPVPRYAWRLPDGRIVCTRCGVWQTGSVPCKPAERPCDGCGYAWEPIRLSIDMAGLTGRRQD